MKCPDCYTDGRVGPSGRCERCAAKELARLTDEEIIRRFHQITYARWQPLQVNWLGAHAIKSPLDLWTYQEIMQEVRPTLVIETGTWNGGSALFLATMMDLMKIDGGRVFSIDIEAKSMPEHERITYLQNDSVCAVLDVNEFTRPDDVVMVILDSDHHKPHVLAEMNAYAPLVTKGSYLIVEDTNINGHPVLPDFGPGPAEAVAEFLASNPGWVPDASRERFLLTCNPGGFLRKM